MIKKILNVSIYKTLKINFYYFNFRQALKIPILIGRKTVIKNLGSKSAVRVENGRISFGILKGSFGLSNNSSNYWDIGKEGSITFHGDASFCRGINLIANGKFDFGNNFSCNANCVFNSAKHISFGDGCLIGWNVTIMDGDGHYILQDNKIVNALKSINIGKHVWIASNSSILKGSTIPDDSVIACNSVISKAFSENNCIIGGNSKILKKEIEWRK